MVYVIQVCWQLASNPVWHIPFLCVQWKDPDDGHRNCPKHVEFYSKNKFEKLVHLVGFIIRIYYDARSPERQIRVLSLSNVTLVNFEIILIGKRISELRLKTWQQMKPRHSLTLPITAYKLVSKKYTQILWYNSVVGSIYMKCRESECSFFVC